MNKTAKHKKSVKENVSIIISNGYIVLVHCLYEYFRFMKAKRSRFQTFLSKLQTYNTQTNNTT